VALFVTSVYLVIHDVIVLESDEELFEEPLQYLQRDIEGSDVDTRRRAATDLVTGLRRYYSQQVTQILSAHIGELLAQYAQNPQANWRAKDQARQAHNFAILVHFSKLPLSRVGVGHLFSHCVGYCC